MSKSSCINDRSEINISLAVGNSALNEDQVVVIRLFYPKKEAIKITI